MCFGFGALGVKGFGVQSLERCCAPGAMLSRMVRWFGSKHGFDLYNHMLIMKA